MLAECAVSLSKTCTRCTIEQPATLEFFPPHKPGKYGVHSLCRPCKKLDDAERRSRPDQKARQKAWRDANRSSVKQYNAQYRANGYSSTEDVRAWRDRNLEHARKSERERRRRQRTDPATALKHRVSARLYAMLRDKGGRSAEELLGFTRHDLMRHIERQFTPGMTWEKVMAGEIHVDHILPVASFGITSVDDPSFKVCWALSNLRPMWKQENVSKGSKRLYLL